MLSAELMESFLMAIREEIAAGSSSLTTRYLDIDAVEQLSDVPGGFVYRLVLSSPLHFTSDQTVEFRTHSPKENIRGSILRSDDQGLVIECDKPLPTDAKLVSLSFDPSFVLKALGKFLLAYQSDPTVIARIALNKELPQSTKKAAERYKDLNQEQSDAIENMRASPVYLLWGPPGTGKTKTIATAVVRWIREKKSVLLVSNSNAAVDVAMKAIIQQCTPSETDHLLRLGNSLDLDVQSITLGGKVSRANLPLAARTAKAQKRLQKIRDELAKRNVPPEKRVSLFLEAGETEKTLTAFNEQALTSLPKIESKVLVTGCTLAKMVLEKSFLEKSFDVVVVDEASMASLLFSLSASFLANSHLVYAGDPKQLPPIVQSNHPEAVKWFGRNVFDWFGVGAKSHPVGTSSGMLKTQYRMTNEIGNVVSRLTYGGLLKSGLNKTGVQIEFIDIQGDWQTTDYSVSEKSYFHLAAVPIVHALQNRDHYDEVLLLSPFRPQRSLLSALAFDLTLEDKSIKASASTIHRSQGSESRNVIVDLTTHSPKQIASFFKDSHSSNLFNVAISRAKDRLIILGSRAMIRELAYSDPFWGAVSNELDSSIKVNTCDSLIGTFSHHESLSSVGLNSEEKTPAICSLSNLGILADDAVKHLNAANSTRKLLVLKGTDEYTYEGKFITRESNNSPCIFTAAGMVCLPHRGKWIAVKSPNVSRVIWRVGFSHLADDELAGGQMSRFNCPDCSYGDLVLRFYNGEGWFLACSESASFTCSYRKRLSLEDAKLKVRFHNMKCNSGHPFTARQSGNKIFIGCENYPDCDHSESLFVLKDM